MDIGFLGGSNILGCGNESDFLHFFEAAKAVAHDCTLKELRRLIFNRLYRRYVRYEDLAETKVCMNFICGKLLKGTSVKGNLHQSCCNIYNTFNEAFDHCVDFLMNMGNIDR